MRLTFQDLIYESVTGLKLDSIFVNTELKTATVNWESEDRFHRHNWELVDWKTEDGNIFFSLSKMDGMSAIFIIEPSGKVRIENIKSLLS